MKLGVALKINLSKIDKKRIFEGKSGAKYLDAFAVIDTVNTSQYGDNGMITQQVTKEERAAKKNGEILGNAKIIFSDGSEATVDVVQSKAQKAKTSNAPFETEDVDDLPF